MDRVHLQRLVDLVNDSRGESNPLYVKYPADPSAYTWIPIASGLKATPQENTWALWIKMNGVGTDILPVSAPIFQLFNQRKGCLFSAVWL